MDCSTDELVLLEGVRVTRPRDGVTLLTIDRPECYNALDEPTMLGLGRLVEELAGDPATRAMVLRGAGPAFCTGGDLDVLRKVAATPDGAGADLLTSAGGAVPALRGMPQPTIAAINGPVAGAGLGLALACDMRVAAPTATFIAPSIHLGLVPDMGVTWLLPRLVGLDVSVELLLSGRQVEAMEAYRLGLVTRLCDDPVSAAVALAATFADMPPRAVAATKSLLHQSLTLDLESAVAAEAREQAAAVHRAGRGDPDELWGAVAVGAQQRERS